MREAVDALVASPAWPAIERDIKTLKSTLLIHNTQFSFTAKLAVAQPSLVLRKFALFTWQT
jgi:hypothetical protein